MRWCKLHVYEYTKLYDIIYDYDSLLHQHGSSVNCLTQSFKMRSVSSPARIPFVPSNELLTWVFHAGADAKINVPQHWQQCTTFSTHHPKILHSMYEYFLQEFHHISSLQKSMANIQDSRNFNNNMHFQILSSNIQTSIKISLPQGPHWEKLSCCSRSSALWHSSWCLRFAIKLHRKPNGIIRFSKPNGTNKLHLLKISTSGCHQVASSASLQGINNVCYKRRA